MVVDEINGNRNALYQALDPSLDYDSFDVDADVTTTLALLLLASLFLTYRRSFFLLSTTNQSSAWHYIATNYTHKHNTHT